MTPMAGPLAPLLAQTDMAPYKQPNINKHASKPRLPIEIILIILTNLDAQTLLSATRTCREWYALARRYRQYLWRHLAWHDFSFTAARGLWKLEFFNDRDLSTCFPRSPPIPSSEQSRGRLHRRTRSTSQSLMKNTDGYSFTKGLAQGQTSIASTPGSVPCGLGVDMGLGHSLNGSQAIEHSESSNGQPINYVPEGRTSGIVESTECKKKRPISNKDSESSGTRSTRFMSDDMSSDAHGIDGNASRSESDFHVHPNQARAGSTPYLDNMRDEIDDLDLLGPDEKDWKALYQLTSNWYRGRAKGYCPIMLPSLTTLASATQSIAQGSLPTSSSLSVSSTLSSSTESSTSSATTTAAAKTVSASTSAQAAIRRILCRRKPQTVVGLQHEGSALTAFSLVAHPFPLSTGDTHEEHSNIESGSKCGQNQGFRDGIALARSNPHYRERRAPTQTQHHNQHHHHNHNHHHHHLNHPQHQLQPQHNPTPNTSQPKQKPNIMVQDPLQHDKAQFAIRVPSPPLQPLPSDVGSNGHSNSSTQPPTQAQPTLVPPVLSPIQVSPPLGQMSDDPANDILCHFSSVLHSFIVTGHMDGSVRLWDLSIKEAGQQCIRLWHTGSRQRVLCVGMNSKVVVCGNVDSTLCVWDIHPAPGTSSSTLGTIHTASYLASTMPPGIEDWVSGIEHICVGDSLVACSTEFSGSVLVFSLATGSLVYEIPGLYQPSKMCMTDFFLLTGGRGAWNRGGRARAQVIAQGHGPHHGHGQDVNRLRNGQNGQNLEVDEYMSCCVNVWDLRTGERLYSLIPRLPISHFQHPANISSMIHGYRDELMLKGKQTEKKRAIRTSSYSPDICSGSRLSAPSINSNSASSTWATRVGTLNNASIVVPSPIAGSGHGSYARSRSTSNSPSLRPNAHGTSPSDSSVSSSSSLSSLSETSFVSTPSEETSQTRHAIRSPPKSPQSPVSAPLTLLDIAVTPDHSTLVVTLCERSGEGREGVYIWDFSGTRLEGYHEQGQESGSTIIVDKNDLRLCANGDSDDGGGWDEGDDRDLDILYGSTTRARDEPNAHYNDSDRDNHDSFDEDDEDQEDESDAVDIDNQFNNNMIMQQVDSTAFSALHQARITGKVWIGWKMAERDFQILRHRYVQRLEAEKRKRQLRRERQMKCREKVDSNLEPKLEQLSVHG